MAGIPGPKGVNGTAPGVRGMPAGGKIPAFARWATLLRALCICGRAVIGPGRKPPCMGVCIAECAQPGKPWWMAVGSPGENIAGASSGPWARCGGI